MIQSASILPYWAGEAVEEHQTYQCALELFKKRETKWTDGWEGHCCCCCYRLCQPFLPRFFIKNPSLIRCASCVVVARLDRWCRKDTRDGLATPASATGNPGTSGTSSYLHDMIRVI